MSRTRHQIAGVIKDRCGATKKARYASKPAAEMALAETQRRREQEGDMRRREARAYSCDFCAGWHLTSSVS